MNFERIGTRVIEICNLEKCSFIICTEKDPYIGFMLRYPKMDSHSDLWGTKSLTLNSDRSTYSTPLTLLYHVTYEYHSPLLIPFVVTFTRWNRCIYTEFLCNSSLFSYSVYRVKSIYVSYTCQSFVKWFYTCVFSFMSFV